MLAVYPGSFDPLTFGHFDLVERASKLFPKVIVAVGHNRARRPLFTLEERLTLLQQTCSGFPNVQVASFEGLLIEYVHQIGARVVIRGLRAGTDFEYELQMALANADIRPDIDTVFLPTRIRYGFISASLVREIASHGGDVSRYAPETVCAALRKKFAAG